jgi:putative acetyltransferase
VIAVAVETPRQEAVAALLRHADAVAAMLYPGAFRRPIDPGALAVPGTHLLVARVDGIAAGCCALFEQGEGRAELKRMIVLEDFRRQGIGETLLRAAEAEARRLGIATLRLEVGIRNEAAHGMYRRAGFAPCEPFPPHVASPISRFLEKPLAARTTAVPKIERL